MFDCLWMDWYYWTNYFKLHKWLLVVCCIELVTRDETYYCLWFKPLLVCFLKRTPHLFLTFWLLTFGFTLTCLFYFLLLVCFHDTVPFHTLKKYTSAVRTCCRSLRAHALFCCLFGLLAYFYDTAPFQITHKKMHLGRAPMSPLTALAPVYCPQSRKSK